MRRPWYNVLPLSLLAVGCHSANTPSLVRVDPSAVEISELPRSVTLVGTGLYRSVSLSLDDDAPAHVVTARVKLDDQPLEVLPQSNNAELKVQLPSVIAPGQYDITVAANGRELHLRSALNIFARQQPDASNARDGAVSSVDAAGETHGDGGQPTSLDSTTPTGDASVDSFSATPRDASVDASTPTAAGDASLSDAALSLSDADSSVLSSDSSDGAVPEVSDVTLIESDTDATLSPLDDASTVDASPKDAAIDATTADASPTADAGGPLFRCAAGEFGSPEVVSVQGYAAGRLWSPTFVADGSTMYFTDGSNGSGKLMKATRPDRGSAFVDAELIPAFFPSGATGTPYVIPSGLALYFYSIQTSGLGSRDLYVATRTSVTDDFSAASTLSGLNSTNLEHLPWVSPDELWLVWVSHRGGEISYWTATRPSKAAAFSTPQNLPSLSFPDHDGRVFITYDGLRAYFVSDERPGGVGSEDIWYATRASLADDFDDITNLGLVNTTSAETDVAVTHDGEELYFVRTGTSNTLYRAVASCN